MGPPRLSWKFECGQVVRAQRGRSTNLGLEAQRDPQHFFWAGDFHGLIDSSEMGLTLRGGDGKHKGENEDGRPVVPACSVHPVGICRCPERGPTHGAGGIPERGGGAPQRPQVRKPRISIPPNAPIATPFVRTCSADPQAGKSRDGFDEKVVFSTPRSGLRRPPRCRRHQKRRPVMCPTNSPRGKSGEALHPLKRPDPAVTHSSPAFLLCTRDAGSSSPTARRSWSRSRPGLAL